MFLWVFSVHTEKKPFAHCLPNQPIRNRFCWLLIIIGPNCGQTTYPHSIYATPILLLVLVLDCFKFQNSKTQFVSATNLFLLAHLGLWWVSNLEREERFWAIHWWYFSQTRDILSTWCKNFHSLDSTHLCSFSPFWLIMGVWKWLFFLPGHLTH